MRAFRRGGFWLRRILRVAVASVVVLVSFGFVAARITDARATDAGMDFGEELHRMGEQSLTGEHGGDLYEIVLNGQPIDSTNASSRHSMHEILDYFQAECKGDASGLGEAFAHLDSAVSKLTPGAGTEGFFTVRREQDDRGFVFCMASDEKRSHAEMIGRLRRAGSTGELGLLGDLRYVTVYREGSGARVFTAWTHGTFNVLTMFPKYGDAPGEDLGGVPRPEGGRRTLSAKIVGAPFGINTYEVLGAPSEVTKEVDTVLLARGWKAVPTAPGVPDDTRFYSLGTAMDVGVHARAARSGETQVSYILSSGLASVSR